MQITHEEAHWLIQHVTDNPLDARKREMLIKHLSVCGSCNAYASEIKEVEVTLQSVMSKQWQGNPLPLSMELILGKYKSKSQAKILLATRFAIVSVIFVVFIFSAWQIEMTNKQTGQGQPFDILPIPTPSQQATQTEATSPACGNIIYVTQENDTLESIARQFATREDRIASENDLKTTPIRAGIELVIPTCATTATVTAHPPTFTTTLTPIFQLTTYTPGQ